MSTLEENLHAALAFHQQGDYAQAERLYREVLSAEPRHADAHHLLGLATLGQGRTSEGVALIRRAIELDDNPAAYHFNLGAALTRVGDHAAAVSSYRAAVERAPEVAAIHEALGSALRATGDSVAAEAEYREAARLDPTLVAAHNNLGNALQDQGRLAEAAEAFTEAVRLQPELAEVHFNLGNCLKEQGRTAEAIAAYEQAVRLRGDLALAQQNLGLALQQVGRYTEAAEQHRRALALDPNLVEAHVALGVALHMAGDLDAAKACYREALALRPHSVSATYNLASALHTQGEIDEAERLYRRTIELRPTHDEALSGLGMLRSLRGDVDEAQRLLEKSLTVNPDGADAHLFRATLLLALGEMPEGWREFEYRFKCRFNTSRQVAAPRWQGEPFPGRTLLVHAEYGYGDTMQFIRYLPMVRERAPGGRIIAAVHPRIIPLLSAAGFADLVSEQEPLPPCDLEVPLLSLPNVFDTTLETIPGRAPYLVAPPGLISHWRERLSTIEGFRVGIHWQGNTKYPADHFRSLRLDYFAPLAEIPGVRLVSLQKEIGTRQIPEAADRFEVLVLDDLDELSGPFLDTAAVIQNLDLVITSDSAVAHLAGALGAPVWLLLSGAADWRWLRDRDDCPWYPTMRLFRQNKLGDWSEVFQRVRAALHARVANTSTDSVRSLPA